MYGKSKKQREELLEDRILNDDEVKMLEGQTVHDAVKNTRVGKVRNAHKNTSPLRGKTPGDMKNEADLNATIQSWLS